MAEVANYSQSQPPSVTGFQTNRDAAQHSFGMSKEPDLQTAATVIQTIAQHRGYMWDHKDQVHITRFARAAGMPEQVITRYLKGQVKYMTVRTAVRFSRAFSVPLEMALGLPEEP